MTGCTDLFYLELAKHCLLSLQMAGYWTQLELTVLTCQNPTVAVGQVDQAVADLSLDVLKVSRHCV